MGALTQGREANRLALELVREISSWSLVHKVLLTNLRYQKSLHFFRASPKHLCWDEGGDWVVTYYGLESRDGTQTIPLRDLDRTDDNGRLYWLVHLGRQMNPQELAKFHEAFDMALSMYHERDRGQVQSTLAYVKRRWRHRLRRSMWLNNIRRRVTDMSSSDDFLALVEEITDVMGGSLRTKLCKEFGVHEALFHPGGAWGVDEKLWNGKPMEFWRKWLQRACHYVTLEIGAEE